MSDLKSVFFGGYSQDSVSEIIADMKRKESVLQNEIESKNRVIAELTDKLLDYRDKELLISDSLIEARERAKNIIDEAQRKADEVYSVAEAAAQEKLKSIEKVIAQLSTVKKDMIRQHQLLKSELVDIIANYGQAIESVDMSKFEAINSEISLDEKLSNQLLSSIKKVPDTTVVLPSHQVDIDDEPMFTFE